MELKIEYLSVNDLTPYENNARKHDTEDVGYIKNSIEEFGMNDPIGIWGDKNVIVEGHGRLLACKELGMQEVPCIRLDNLTDEQRKAYALAHNKTAEMSAWDFDLLDEELDSIFDIDMGDFGFELADDEEDVEIIEDEPPEMDEDAEPVAQLGDIYQLGRHRLMCGDSTDKECVEQLMNGEKANMVFTDPPYGVSYEGGLNEKKKKQIMNDSLTEDELYKFLLDVFVNVKRYTKEKSGIYVFYAHSNTRQFINAFYDSKLKQRSIIIWHKTSGGFGDFMAQYMNAYEPCIYGSNGGTVNWYGPTNEKTVWNMDKGKKCELHPTMKPLELVSRAINNSSKITDKVLDLFGGSGSTLMVCEQMNRNCYMMELDPHYVDVIIKRWEDFTGKKAVKIN